jgi:uncharacterized protein YndB with AHSA1/START domain
LGTQAWRRRRSGTDRGEHRDARPPDEVFAYVTNPSLLAEWQESVVNSRPEGTGPPGMGTRAVVTRQVGRSERTMTAELGEFNPPKSWGVRGIDGPVRGNVNGTIEPLDDGARSRVTLELELVGHGIGKLLVPLFIRRQARNEVPTNLRNLKERLERGA